MEVVFEFLKTDYPSFAYCKSGSWELSGTLGLPNRCLKMRPNRPTFNFTKHTQQKNILKQTLDLHRTIAIFASIILSATK
jgi:hypothetical protein